MKGNKNRKSLSFTYVCIPLIFLTYGFSCGTKNAETQPKTTFDITLSGSVKMAFRGANARFQVENNPAMDGNPKQITVILVNADGYRMTPYYISKELKPGTYSMNGLQAGALFGSQKQPTEYASVSGQISFKTISSNRVTGSIKCIFANRDRSKTISASGTFDAIPLHN